MVERRRVSAGEVCFGCRASVVEVIAGCPEGVNGMVHRPKSGDSSDVRTFVLQDRYFHGVAHKVFPAVIDSEFSSFTREEESAEPLEPPDIQTRKGREG